MRITIESDRNASEIQTIATNILGAHTGVIQAGRLGNEITLHGDPNADEIHQLRSDLASDGHKIHVTLEGEDTMEYAGHPDGPWTKGSGYVSPEQPTREPVTDQHIGDLVDSTYENATLVRKVDGSLAVIQTPAHLAGATALAFWLDYDSYCKGVDDVEQRANFAVTVNDYEALQAWQR